MRDIDAQTLDAARQGSSPALAALLRTIQPPIYGLALRMLWHPEDARDATQEVLLKVLTHLGTFREESRFSTWVFRVAVNHLRDFRKGRLETVPLDFESLAHDLRGGLADQDHGRETDPEHQAVLEEIKVGCTHAMLACLDRAQRLVYILGEIFEIGDEAAAQALELTPTAFRKRLSRARRMISAFMQAHCGIVNPQCRCRCARRIDTAVALGRVDPARLLFVDRATADASYAAAVTEVRSLDATRRAAALMRSSRPPVPDVAAEVLDLILRRHG